MNGRQKVKLDALHRMQVFLTQNAAVLGGVNQSQSRAALDQAVTAVEAKVVDQMVAEVAATSATVQKTFLRGVLRRQHMQPIAAIARTQFAGTPSMTTLQMPATKASDAELVRVGTAMAQTAAQYPAVFASEQLPADFVAQLEGAVQAVQTAVATRNAARLQLRTATQGIEDQLTLARSTVQVVQALVGKQLDGKTDLLAAWRTAKRHQAKPGVARGTTRTPDATAASAPTAPTLMPPAGAVAAAEPVASAMANAA